MLTTSSGNPTMPASAETTGPGSETDGRARHMLLSVRWGPREPSRRGVAFSRQKSPMASWSLVPSPRFAFGHPAVAREYLPKIYDPRCGRTGAGERGRCREIAAGWRVRRVLPPGALGLEAPAGWRKIAHVSKTPVVFVVCDRGVATVTKFPAGVFLPEILIKKALAIYGCSS